MAVPRCVIQMSRCLEKQGLHVTAPHAGAVEGGSDALPHHAPERVRRLRGYEAGLRRVARALRVPKGRASTLGRATNQIRCTPAQVGGPTSRR